MLKRLWNSPTFMTWGNLSAKSSNLVILLPVVLTTFSQEDIVVWYLYFTIVSLQMLIDFGFLPTFSRLFSYAYCGLTIEEISNIKNNKNASGEVNWESLEYIFTATKKIYSKLSLVTLLIASTAGSWLVYEPITNSSNPTTAWIGWFFVIAIASLNLYANSYVALLTGMNKVALIQRWQMISSLFAVVVSSLFIILTKSLSIGIGTYYIWYLLNFYINYSLSKKYYKNTDNKQLNQNLLKKLIKQTIWPTAWKSGVGVGMSMGLIQLSGMIVSRLETAMVASSYMIALQIIRAISSFSQAPFYSKLPYFAQLYSKNHISELIAISKKAMQKSFAVYLIMFLIIGLFANDLLSLIGSKTKFVDDTIWAMIGFAFLLERYGAMYLQLYTLTNHIIWHIANGITGLFMIMFVFILHNSLGLVSFPFAMILAYGFYFVPYVLSKTYKEYKLNFITQEKDNFVLVLLVFSASIILITEKG